MLNNQLEKAVRKNKMQLNIEKCGAMQVGCSANGNMRKANIIKIGDT
jgi:hypothetical protein